jgi:hypothetical protein
VKCLRGGLVGELSHVDELDRFAKLGLKRLKRSHDLVAEPLARGALAERGNRSQRVERRAFALSLSIVVHVRVE